MTAARKASDGPVHAHAGPVFADRTGLSADDPPGLSRQPAAGTPRDSAADGDAAGSGAGRAHGTAAGVLADRLAAALVHHEPGWRLPRHTALARRYNVSTAEIDVAVGELAARHLISRMPDGQLYRASPAEYLIPLEGTPRLASHLDPMGAKITCRSRQVSWRRVPEDIGWVLGVPPGDSACVVRLLWTADGEPAALATTYLSRHIAGQPADKGAAAPAAVTALPLLMTPGTDDGTAAAGRPRGGLGAARALRRDAPAAALGRQEPPARLRPVRRHGHRAIRRSSPGPAGRPRDNRAPPRPVQDRGGVSRRFLPARN